MTGCILTTCIILLCPFRLHAADNKDKSIFWLIPFASFSRKNIKPEGQNFTYNAMQLIGMEETKLTSNDQVIIKPEDIEKINNLIQKNTVNCPSIVLK